MPPKPPNRDIFSGDSFTFCRIQYTSVRDEALGHGWNTDYPDSDINFMIRLSELTNIRINREKDGAPNHVVVEPTDEALFDYPFAFMSDVGTAGFDEREAKHLRKYLLRGGFLYVDDFWGDRAWEHWAGQMDKVLPREDYPIRDIPLSHDIFHIVFDVKEMPQVPSIQHWRRTGGTSVSERGAESAEPHLRGIWDKQGRLMVVMSHNTDIADGWEREGEDREYFERFSVKHAYPLGINIVVYAMTH